MIDLIQNDLKTYLEGLNIFKKVDVDSVSLSNFINSLNIPDDLPSIFFNLNLNTNVKLEWKPSYTTKELLSFQLYVIDDIDNLNIKSYIDKILEYNKWTKKNTNCNVIIKSYQITNNIPDGIGKQSTYKLIIFDLQIFYYNQY